MIRFQGTDGVRRITALSAEPSLRGVSPQAAFLEKDALTEQFAELYAYCRVKWLLENGFSAKKDEFVVGWDPRDVGGAFTSAVVSGVLKAGCNVAVIGVAPTPAVSLFSRHIGATGAFVITASHNPASYNGIKIFTRLGLKLLPGDDMALSAAVMETDYETVKALPREGTERDLRDEARRFFVEFSLNRGNSWIVEAKPLATVTVIVDCANGAYSGVAEEIFKKAGFGDVTVVNTNAGAEINVRSGVADLEGVHEITPDTVENGGRFARHEAMKAIFKIGLANREKIKNGETMVVGAVFDGDGDRFFSPIYDPFTGNVFVLSGDETAILQAMNIKGEGKLSVNTVESDLNAAIRAEELGYETRLASVGDKWLLLAATLSAARPNVNDAAWSKIESAAYGAKPSADAIERILEEAKAELAAPDKITFAIGGEESGHNISAGVVDAGDKKHTAFAGNGIKSCLNMCAALFCGGVISGMDAKTKIEFLRRPFPSGFKKTLYAFYVDKGRFKRGSAVWEKVKEAIKKSIAETFSGASASEMIRPEDEDMLYVKIVRSGKHIASAFARNSGTEDKIGVSLRGPMESKEALLGIGEKVLRLFLVEMKDLSKTFAVAELEVLKAASGKGAPENPVAGLAAAEYERLLNETGLKQGLLDKATPGARLTKRGIWYLEQIPRKLGGE